jgi:light-regulated signal transduction histidine kinase (bacteriophytochrome)
MMVASHACGISVDVTERRRAEEQISRSTPARAGARLTAANTELESQLLGFHDLRAPLRAVDGYSQFLEEDYSDRLDDEDAVCWAWFAIAAGDGDIDR